MTRKYLVVGGNGYVGSHMCKYLVEKGEEVHVFDNFSTSSKAHKHNYGTYHEVDLSDPKKVSILLSKVSPDAVLHYAARALVPESEENPLLYYQENLVNTVNLLQGCIENNVKQFVFSSTCATFGVPKENQSIHEKLPQRPINTYGRTKLLMENVMQDLADKKLIDILVFRYFNAAGCDPKGSIGENHEPETHLIPNICKSFLSGGSQVLKIFGTDYPTPDGTCIRDYVHVDDLARTHYEGIEWLMSNPGYHDFNLGSENGSSILEVIAAFEEVTGEKIQTEKSSRRPGDPPRLVADSAKAKEKLNFRLDYDLKDCISHTLNYLKGK